MKKSAKLVSLLLAVMMVMVAFAACTGSTQSDEPKTSEAANTEAATTPRRPSGGRASGSTGGAVQHRWARNIRGTNREGGAFI